jgi:hypothetical protein
MMMMMMMLLHNMAQLQRPWHRGALTLVVEASADFGSAAP